MLLRERAAQILRERSQHQLRPSRLTPGEVSICIAFEEILAAKLAPLYLENHTLRTDLNDLKHGVSPR